MMTSRWFPDLPEGWRVNDPGYPGVIRVSYQRGRKARVPCNPVLARLREVVGTFGLGTGILMVENELQPQRQWELGATGAEVEHAEKVIDRLKSLL